MIRIDRFLALKALGTRTEIKKLLKKKVVLVNGEVVVDPKTKVGSDDVVSYGEYEFRYEPLVYYVLNKPKDFISATEDNYHDVVVDLLSDADYQTDIFPIGRLDIDTTGLLILTNDGDLGHILTSPKHHVDKTYLVTIDHALSDAEIKRLEAGVIILEDYLTKPAKVEVIDDNHIYLTISEGKFHQVKNMLKAVDNEVLELERVKMGELKLPNDLELGEYIKMTNEEILEQIKKG